MRAFHDDPHIKFKLVNRCIASRGAGRFRQGGCHDEHDMQTGCATAIMLQTPHPRLRDFDTQFGLSYFRMAVSTHDRAARNLLARNLRRIRLERGLTQEMLSLESGVMQSHLSEIEAGKRNASVDLIGAVAHALGVPVALLFEEVPVT